MVPGGKTQLMSGVVTGLAKKTSKPIVDGIYTGIHKDASMKIGSDIKKVKPSATERAIGEFGGISAPEGKGRGR